MTSAYPNSDSCRSPDAAARPLQVALLVNPRSGRGRAESVAQQVRESLENAGHHVVMREIRATDEPTGDVLVIIGGDGTVHHSLPLASRLGVPVWQIPMGTENLFARSFGMTREPALLVQALAAMSVEAVDLAECRVVSRSANQSDIAIASSLSAESTPRSFVLMLSVGPDAGVVRRLTQRRTGAIRHSSYISPIMREACLPSLSPMSIEVDGRSVVDSRSGLLVVANSPEYGVRLNPCPDARMNDGLLNLSFFPASSSLELLGWVLRARIGTHLLSNRLIHLTGRDIRVRCTSGILPIQLDGEAGGVLESHQELLIRVVPAGMKVLKPAKATI